MGTSGSELKISFSTHQYSNPIAPASKSAPRLPISDNKGSNMKSTPTASYSWQFSWLSLPILAFCWCLLLSTSGWAAPQQASGTSAEETETDKEKKIGNRNFGAGCFWCTEAVFQRVKGVEKSPQATWEVQPRTKTYKDICTGLTGHAEVIQVQFDPTVVSFVELLEIFWKTHDPTTLNKQGRTRELNIVRSSSSTPSPSRKKLNSIKRNSMKRRSLRTKSSPRSAQLLSLCRGRLSPKLFQRQSSPRLLPFGNHPQT